MTDLTEERLVEFNVNHYVRVRLTPIGKRILRKRHEALGMPSDKFPYREPKVDADGYTRFQLWDLMHTFGYATYNGQQVPFETVIQFESEALITALADAAKAEARVAELERKIVDDAGWAARARVGRGPFIIPQSDIDEAGQRAEDAARAALSSKQDGDA